MKTLLSLAVLVVVLIALSTAVQHLRNHVQEQVPVDIGCALVVTHEGSVCT